MTPAQRLAELRAKATGANRNHRAKGIAMNDSDQPQPTGTVRDRLRIVIPPNVLGAVVIDFIGDGGEVRYLIKAPSGCNVRCGDRERLRVILEDV